MNKFLVILGLLSQVSFGAETVTPSLSPNVQKYRDRQTKATKESVLQWLMEGNKRFAAGKSTHGGFHQNAKSRIEASSKGQRPLAVVLSCIDSRTTPEEVFDMSVGDLFTIRIGGNVINDDVIGSLEVTADSGTKVVVILGHTDCAGMKGACEGWEYGHFTQLLDKIKPAIKILDDQLDKDPIRSSQIGERNAKNRKYIAALGHVHAVYEREQILKRSPILAEKISKGDILLLSAIYNVETGKVEFDLEFSTAPLKARGSTKLR